MTITPQTKAYFALAFSMLVFAGHAIVLKIIIEPVHGYTALQISFIRQVLATLVMLPIAGGLAWHNRHLLWQHRWFLFKATVFGFFLHATTFSVGLQHSTALNNYLISAMTPVFAVLISMGIYKQWVSLHTLFNIILCIFGVIIIIGRGDMNTFATLQINVGDIFFVAGTLFWAAYGFVVRGKPSELKMPMLMVVGLAVSSVFILPLIWVTDNMDFNKDVWDIDFIMLIAYTGILVQIFAILAYSYATTVLDGVIPAVSMNSIPLIGSLMAIGILGEIFHTYHALAVALISVSLYNIVRRDIRKRQQQSPQKSNQKSNQKPPIG